MGIDDVGVAVQAHDADAVPSQAGTDLRGGLPVGLERVETDVGKGKIRHHAAEPFRLDLGHRLFERKMGVDVRHDAQVQIFMGRRLPIGGGGPQRASPEHDCRRGLEPVAAAKRGGQQIVVDFRDRVHSLISSFCGKQKPQKKAYLPTIPGGDWPTPRRKAFARLRTTYTTPVPKETRLLFPSLPAFSAR